MATTIQEVTDYVLKTPLNTNKAILHAMLVDLAGSQSDDGIVQLRRDNDYNYDKIGDTFIPANGEFCLVDTARDGLRIKCGDGVSTWNELDYIDNYIIPGYYHNGQFYKDSSYTQSVAGATNRLYVDVKQRALYFFYENEFIFITGGGTTPETTATEEVAGTMKLYQSSGVKTDGTMSQKAISEELDQKVEISLDIGEELLVFTND